MNKNYDSAPFSEMKKYMTQRFAFVGGDFGAAASIRKQLQVTTGSKRALEALRGGFRAPEQAQKEAQMPPERVPKGASEEGKDDPEAEGLKKEGSKSSKIGTIQKRSLSVYGKHILKE